MDLEKVLLSFSFWQPFLRRGVKIVLVLVAAVVSNYFLRMVIRHLHRPANFLPHPWRRAPSARWRTITSLLITSSQLVVNFFAFMLILDFLGVNLTPFLAGAGIIGLGIGFGAKTLVSDFIAGFFILLEEQFNVGDWVQIGNYRGRVKKISLRTVLLVDQQGNYYIIPNSTIKTVICLKKPPKKI